MPKQLAEIKKLRTRFNILASQLGFANTHLHYFLKLEGAREQYGSAFFKSYDFWEYTKRAHLEIATIYLCRTYDKHGKADHLWHFLKDISKNGLNENQKNLLKADIVFCGDKSTEQAIVKLRHWRNNFGAHFSHRLATPEGRKELTRTKSPSIAEIQQLIDKGFEILERWASFYESSSKFQKLISNTDDYLFVLEAIQAKRIQMKVKK